MATQTTINKTGPSVHHAPGEIGTITATFGTARVRRAASLVSAPSIRPDSDTERHLGRSLSLVERLSRAVDARSSL